MISQIHKTPDGSMHLSINDSGAIRIPDKMSLFEFKGFKIPEHLILLTGAGSETLDTIGQAHITNYKKFMGLEPDMTLLEIGCGIGRDAFQLIDFLSAEGKYVGVDVTRDSIVWCQNNITPRYPNFEFIHFDAQHELYNPLGTKKTMDFTLPAEDQSVDRIFLGSIFTHLFKEEVIHYMKESARVLKPTGMAYATFFLYSQKTINSARDTNLTPFNLKFEHAVGEGCYINDAQFPTGAVAYSDEAMRQMMKASGVYLIRPYLKGWWSGAYKNADDGQEVAVISNTQQGGILNKIFNF